MKSTLTVMTYCIALLTQSLGECMELNPPCNSKFLEQIILNKNQPDILRSLLPILKGSLTCSKYENILMTQLRDVHTSKTQFRNISNKLADILVAKVVECLPTHFIEIATPLMTTGGLTFSKPIELVSVMRSGDALVEKFIENFPDANVSKILVQRNEETAVPEFKYMKLSPSIGFDHNAIILEPMIATGGTLGMVIELLIMKGVKEENIIIASICAAPEGLLHLQTLFPKIGIVLIKLDDKLNEQKFILPGIGDFGDRFFGTQTERSFR